MLSSFSFDRRIWLFIKRNEISNFDSVRKFVLRNRNVEALEALVVVRFKLSDKIFFASDTDVETFVLFS